MQYNYYKQIDKYSDLGSVSIDLDIKIPNLDNINGILILFEPDEERNFRAIVDPSIDQANHKIDKEVIQLIAEALAEMLK